MNTIKHYLSVIMYTYEIGLKREMEYISYSLCWFIMIPVSAFSGYYVLKVITDQNGNINGWTLGQIAFLYGLSLFSHGFQDLLFIQTRHIDDMIINGQFDRALLRPMDVFVQFITSNINIDGISSFVPAVVLFAYGCGLVQFQWTLTNGISVVMIIVGGTLISFAIFSITGCIAFWTKKSSFLTSLNLMVIDKMTSYPMTIYPAVLRGVFTFLIPVGFITFYPVCGLLHMDTGMKVDFPIPIELPVLSLLIGVGSFCLARCFFNYALKHKYESTGS